MARIPIPLIQPDSPARFPPVHRAMEEPNGLLAMGGDLAPERLLAAYAHGIFPWFGEGEPILWWSPDPRCVFRTDAVHCTRRLHRQLRASDWMVTTDRAFHQVMLACAAPRSDVAGGTWITEQMIAAYVALHRLGHAHSIEVWEGDTLAGGMYGVMVGRLFCGESMFSARSGGSKAALLCVCRMLHQHACPLLDAQVGNPHLLSLGAIEMPRAQFMDALAALRGDTAGALFERGAAPVSVASLLL